MDSDDDMHSFGDACYGDEEAELGSYGDDDVEDDDIEDYAFEEDDGNGSDGCPSHRAVKMQDLLLCFYN